MSADAMWRAFARTGEPLFYLLYRAASEERGNGQDPRGRAAAG